MITNTFNGRYVLAADGKTPVLEPDLLTWARWFENAERHVAIDELSDTVRVSTVFLGLDHRYGDGAPLLWETMIFGLADDSYQVRYETYDDAVAGHATALDYARGRMLIESA